MRPILKFLSLTVTLALVAGCADSPAPPGVGELMLSETAWSEGLLTGEDVQDLHRPLLDVTAWEDARTIVPIEVLTPEAAEDIGPGSAIVITIPDEGRFGCTANFIFSGRGRQYLGSAGHCFLPGDKSATHGPGADYDASGVVVEVCVEDCEGNFRTNLLVGTWVTLDEVAYARQESPTGAQVGHDFGVVEIPRKIEAVVRTNMPVWGGPTGVDALQLGDYGCHYGHGLGVGEVFPTKARVGVGGGSNENSWAGDFAGSFGDSGSGMVVCEPTAVTFVGGAAVGVLTHLGIRLSTTGEHGVILGTNITRAIEMATEANLKLTLVLE